MATTFNPSSYFYDKLMPYIATVEGGFVNDPLGGPTYMGITEKTLLVFVGNTSGSNVGWNVKDLINKPELIATIYLAWYYLPVHGYELPPKTGVVMFDGAVQHGIGTIVRMLQRVIGESPEDGLFGPDTLAKALQFIHTTGHSDDQLASDLLTIRKQLYMGLNQPSDIQGWEDRLEYLANTFQINWNWN